MSKSQNPSLLPAWISVGITIMIAVFALMASSCARKNSDPPTVEGYGMGQLQQDAKLRDENAKSVPPAKNGDKLLKLILADKKVATFIAAYQKSNSVTCTRPAAGQINWNCKSDTQCAFSLETTCVSDVTTSSSNDQLVRVSILGEGDTTKMTYKISDPVKTAAESKVVRVKFEY